MKEGAWNLETAQIWAVALTDLGINERLFFNAYRKSLTLEWLPTAPQDFFALADNGFDFPDVRYAFEVSVEIASRIDVMEFPHIAIYEAYSRIGSWALSHESEYTLWKRYQETYKQVCNEIKQGAIFKIPEQKQIERVSIPVSSEQAKAYLKEIQKNINMAKLGEVA